MATNDTYNFIVAAKDNASATLRRVSGELKTMGGAGATAASPLSRLSAITGGLVNPTTLAIGAAAGLAFQLGAAAKAAVEDQKSQALLKASLEANIPAFDGNTSAIEKVISSRMRLGFADEEQRDSLRQLIAVTKNSTEALKLQRTAMDLARLKGISLETSSNLLGKVWAGNVSILGRYGIQLEKGTTATEALAEIQRRAAGQAEEYAGTLDGKLEALGIAFDELAESVGYLIVGPLTDLVGFINDPVIPTVGRLSDAITDLWDKMRGGTPTVEEINTEFTQAFGFDFPQAVEEGGEAVVKSFNAWRPGMQAASHAVVVDPIREALEASRAAARREASKIPSDLASALTDALPDLKDGLNELRTMMDHELSTTARIARLRGILTSEELADGLKSKDPYVRARAREIQQSARQELRELKTGAADAAADGGDAYADFLKRKQAKVARVAKDLAQEAKNMLEFDASDAGDTVGTTWVNGLAIGIRAGVGVINDAILYAKINSIGGSLPKSGPLAARELDSAAKSVADYYTTSLSRNLQGGVMAPSIGGARALPMATGAVGGFTVNFNSTFPPTPAQADALARNIGPAMERWRRRNT